MVVKKTRVAVLASGRGSNFVALYDANLPDVEFVGVICNKPGAGVIDHAKARNVPVTMIPVKATDSEVLAALKPCAPDVICLAGYMRIVGREFLKAYEGRVLNIHPSLLPSFRGLHAVKQALEKGVKWTGCTVHVVTEELDDGPILAQNVVRVMPEDTEATLSQRLLDIEHATYVSALQNFISRK